MLSQEIVIISSSTNVASLPKISAEPDSFDTQIIFLKETVQYFRIIFSTIQGCTSVKWIIFYEKLSILFNLES